LPSRVMFLDYTPSKSSRSDRHRRCGLSSRLPGLLLSCAPQQGPGLMPGRTGYIRTLTLKQACHTSSVARIMEGHRAVTDLDTRWHPERSLWGEMRCRFASCREHHRRSGRDENAGGVAVGLAAAEPACPAYLFPWTRSCLQAGDAWVWPGGVSWPCGIEHDMPFGVRDGWASAD